MPESSRIASLTARRARCSRPRRIAAPPALTAAETQHVRNAVQFFHALFIYAGGGTTGEREGARSFAWSLAGAAPHVQRAALRLLKAEWPWLCDESEQRIRELWAFARGVAAEVAG